MNSCLVFRLKHLGDFLLILPVVWGIKRQYPGIKFTLVTGKWNRGLAESCRQLFGHIIYYNSNRFCRRSDERMAISERFAVWKGLMRQRFDLCLDFDGVNSFLPFYILKRTKYLAAVEALRFFQNLEDMGLRESPYRYHTHNQYERDNLAAVLQLWDWEDQSFDFDVREFFAIPRAPANKVPRIGIHPGAGDPKKRFPLEFWAKIISAFALNYPEVRFRLHGPKNEKADLCALVSLGQTEMDIFADHSIKEFIQLFNQNDLVIGLDSFAQHVAYLANIPSIIIYRQDNRNRWALKNQKWHQSVLIDKDITNTQEMIDRFWQQVPHPFLQRVLCR
jgi:ADP-heptose:LPS heptosyltransferase